MGRFLVIGMVSGLAALIAGCASSSDKIAPSYISPIVYQDYSCQQLGEEAQRVIGNANRLAGVQDERATNDAIATGVALVVFWPAAFLVSGGDGASAAELAKLRGQKDAIEQAAIKKNCGITFQGEKAKA